MPYKKGARIGEWKILGRAPSPDNDTHAYWRCQCSCGTVKDLQGKMLRSGSSKSCHGKGSAPRRKVPLSVRFWKHVIHATQTNSCWIWQGSPTKDGYGQIKGHNREMLRAHRVSYMLHKGKIPAGLEVCHTCDTRLCVNPDHLVIGTRQFNEDDKVAKNRQAIGEAHGKALLNSIKVKRIRRMYTKGATYDALASKFHVNRSTIAQVVLRRTWKHVS